MTGLTLRAHDIPEVTQSELVWIDLPGPVRLGFDPGQALDLRHVVIDGHDLAPLADAPGLADPLVARALQGVMFTCGPDHIRQACRTQDAMGRLVDWPLHGNLMRTAAKEVSVVQAAAHTEVRANIDVFGAHGGAIEVLRRYHIWHDPLMVVLSDKISNVGAEPFDPMMMYHVNIPGRYLTETSAVTSSEGALAIGLRDDTRKTCRVWDGRAHLALANAPVTGLAIGADTGTLPLLQTWQHSDSQRRILSIEPVSHQMDDRSDLQSAGALQPLPAGASQNYEVSLAFTVA